MSLIKNEFTVKLRKEWKSAVLAIWLIGISVLGISINSRLKAVQRQNAMLMSTVDAVEGVAIGTDSNVAELSEKLDGIASAMEFVISKLRNR